MCGARSGDALCLIPASKVRGNIGNLEFCCWFQQGFVDKLLKLEKMPSYPACSWYSDASWFFYIYILQRGKQVSNTLSLKL